MSREWGVSAQEKQLVFYAEEHRQRMGHCRWLPSPGDLCMCVGHSGDYFHDYIAMRQQKGGKWKMVGKFGAYGFGELFDAKISDRTYHLLQAGEPCELKIPAKAVPS